VVLVAFEEESFKEDEDSIDDDDDDDVVTDEFPINDSFSLRHMMMNLMIPFIMIIEKTLR
jgi:hypothetical protein